jgi:hypothetical protein
MSSAGVTSFMTARQLAALDQALHIADDALRLAPMHSVAEVQAALLLMDDAGRLASSALPVLAGLIRRAEHVVVGDGRAARMNPEERRALARSILESVLGGVHVEYPHPAVTRLH